MCAWRRIDAVHYGGDARLDSESLLSTLCLATECSVLHSCTPCLTPRPPMGKMLSFTMSMLCWPSGPMMLHFHRQNILPCSAARRFTCCSAIGFCSGVLVCDYAPNLHNLPDETRTQHPVNQSPACGCFGMQRTAAVLISTQKTYLWPQLHRCEHVHNTSTL